MFRTITENIKSFFEKEEQLEKPPKKVADSAMELFEKPRPDHQIVRYPLVAAQPAPQPAKPQLPFTAQQLREKLGQPMPAPAAPAASAPRIKSDDIAVQIAEFERAIHSIPGEDGSSVPLSASAPRSKPSHSASSSSSPIPSSQPPAGLFDSVAHQLDNRGYESLDEEMLSEEVIERMREHHVRRIADERHRGRALDLEHDLAHKLAQLRGLEHEWASKQEESLIARERMRELEDEIASGVSQLKELVGAMKRHVAASPAPSQPGDSSASNYRAPGLPVSSVSASLREVLPGRQDAVDSMPVDRNALAPSGAALPVPLTQESVPRALPQLRSSNAPRTHRTPPLSVEQRFYLANGQALSSLTELRDALVSMDDSVFHHHVTPHKNDFSSWVLGVFKEEPLARRIRHARSRSEMASMLDEHPSTK